MFCPTCHADYPETWKVCPKDATPMLASSTVLSEDAPKVEPPQRASPWIPLAMLVVVIVVGSAIWMLTH